MTVLRRGNSKSLYIQFKAGGRTIVRSARTTNRKVAEQLEARLRTEIHAQTYLGQKPAIPLGKALRRFVAAKEGTPNHRNLLGHLKALEAFISFLKPLELVSSEDIESFVVGRRAAGVGPQTIKHGLNVVRGTIKLLKRQGFRVPDLYIPPIKVPAGRLRYLTADEERRLLQEFDPSRIRPGLATPEKRRADIRTALQDLYDLVVILLDTGARCGEIGRLEWEQVDLQNRAIHIWRPKVSNESILFMPDRTFEILSRRKQATMGRYVFADRDGGPRKHHHSSWRKAFNRAGLHDCTIHTIRHTTATRLVQNGLSIYEVQTVLGHADAKTTMRYAHLEQASVTRKAKEVLNALNAASVCSSGPLAEMERA